ncbi:MAG: hypothetical protein WD824_09500 [Cyclobacteriaceae bacterium]
MNKSGNHGKENAVYYNHQLCCVLFTILLFSLSTPTSNGQQKAEHIKIDKAFISFRIGTSQSLPEKRFNELLDLFDKYKGVTDEITFFTSVTHAPIPLDLFKQRMRIFKKRMLQARKRGYKSGLNILTTIGHHNENLENSLKGDYTNLTDIEGQISQGSYCPNDIKMQEYIREVYKSMVLANPDYIWLDDDIRLAGHKPISLTCFCDNCLSIFETENGKKYSRESFKKAVNESPVHEKLQLRNAWLQHNRNTIARLFTLIETTVHDIRPGMPLGFMTGDRFFEGYDFDNWKKVLAGPNASPVMWRPGGGFYQDNNTPGLAGKSHDIGRQVSLLPGEVHSIQSEIEAFPYQRLKKAANIVALEASSHIASGCTGSAFNVLSMYDESLDEYEALIAKLHKSRPFFDLMTRTLGRSKINGVNTFWNKNSFSTGNIEKGNWFSSGNPVTGHEIYEIGLPAAYSAKHASVILLGKDNIYALSKEEIEKILSNGVYMDAATLQQLNEMGYGKLTGFEVVELYKADRIEKFTGHLLNGSYAGRERDNRQSFYYVPAYTLRKTNDNAQTLTSLIDYADKEVGACTMGVFENSLGGRICVAGYYPWTFMENLSKSAQMKSVFRWLSKETLQGYVASFHKINLWIREPQHGKIALAFSNSSFDPAENVTLMLNTTSKTIKVYDMNNKETMIRSAGPDGPYQKFVIPYVDPWQMRLVLSE